MKAILLAGGFGTRLRPLTMHTPKPIVPIFDRPFLYYQIDLLKQVPEIDEVILSLNYQPAEIEALVGDGAETGLRIRYLVEPSPLGTGGAIKFAAPHLDGTVIVFNGDVLTKIDLAALVALHRRRRARATVVLTPVDNPAAYGLVETDTEGNVRRFLEKPSPDEITCNTINAGIYVLEPETFDRIPSDTKYSIERRYFPSLVEQGETFVAHINRDYWLDIGTPETYGQAHRDIMTGRCAAPPFDEGRVGQAVVDPTASVHPRAKLEPPCFIGARARIGDGARIAAHSVVCRSVAVGENATIDGAIIWPETVIGADATVHDAIIGRGARVDPYAVIGPGVVVGDHSVLTAHTKLSRGSGPAV